MSSTTTNNANQFQLSDGRPEVRYDPALRHIWPWPALLMEKVADWIFSLPGDTWLDAACGEGQLAKLIGCQKNLVGLDASALKLNQARRYEYTSLIQASLVSIPIPDSIQDGIACVETLEHITDMESVLGEVYRCLKPEGYFILSMPSVTLRSLWQMHKTRQPVYCDVNEHVRELTSVALNDFHHRFEKWETIEALVASFGFDIVRSGGVGFLLPMFNGRFRFLEHFMQIIYKEGINNVIGRFPLIRNFPYYRVYLFRKIKT